jgi:hypothetical protein
MSSRRELIIRNRVGALKAGAPAEVHRYRIRPIERDQLPAYVVYPANPPLGGQSEVVERLDHDPGVERRLNLRVEIRVEVTDPNDEPDSVLDEHYVHVVKALRADPTCGGLALDCEESSSSFDAADLGKEVGACAVDFVITYHTDEDDPEGAAP